MAKTVGQNIRDERERLGLDQKVVAARIGVPQSQLSAWENDRYNTIDSRNLLRIATGLGCRVDKLLTEVDPRYTELWVEANAVVDGLHDVDAGRIDVSGHTREDIPVIAEGEASPQGSLFWGDDGTLLSEVEDRITRPYDVHDPHAYGLRVRGESMLRFYKPGDLVVVSPRTPVSDGDEVYVQLLSGERLIKVAHRMNDGFLLESYNQAYAPRFVERANVGAMHPIVWSKRKISGVRAMLTRGSQLPPPKNKRSQSTAPAARDDMHEFSQLPNGDPIWVDEPSDES